MMELTKRDIILSFVALCSINILASIDSTALSVCIPVSLPETLNLALTDG